MEELLPRFHWRMNGEGQGLFFFYLKHLIMCGFSNIKKKHYVETTAYYAATNKQ